MTYLILAVLACATSRQGNDQRYKIDEKLDIISFLALRQDLAPGVHRNVLFFPVQLQLHAFWNFDV